MAQCWAATVPLTRASRVLHIQSSLVPYWRNDLNESIARLAGATTTRQTIDALGDVPGIGELGFGNIAEWLFLCHAQTLFSSSSSPRNRQNSSRVRAPTCNVFSNGLGSLSRRNAFEDSLAEAAKLLKS